MTFPPVYILSAVRTPIGRLGGALAPLSAVTLGSVAARAAIQRAGVQPEEIDEVIMGHGRQAGCGPNPARQVVRAAGLPDSVPAFTVNKACASGIKAITLAAAAIWTEGRSLVLAGGMESMSNTPYLLRRARGGYRLGHAEVEDAMYADGFMCPLCSTLMGGTAENLADRYGITRREQDEYAVESQRRAAAASASGTFTTEIEAVSVPSKKGEVLISQDEHPRSDTTLESLSRLAPVFRKDGTVHAGNSSGITDGAAAVVVASEEATKKLGARPLARLLCFTTAAVDPAYMGIGPVPSLHSLWERSGLSLADVDLIELNEAFAAQVLACERELKFDRDRVNVNGGAIALGHPIGATGARIVTTLLHELARRGGRYGVATLCVSGGMGMSLLFERG
jgi:acetyl-CoA C-acetyltransferase